MKKLLLIFITLILLAGCQKKFTGVYNFNNNPNEVIKFFDGSNYAIATKEVDGNKGCLIVTEGNYEYKNRLLILNNKHWYKMYDPSETDHELIQLDLTIVYKIDSDQDEFIYAEIHDVYKRDGEFRDDEKQVVTSMIGNKVLFCKIN